MKRKRFDDWGFQDYRSAITGALALMGDADHESMARIAIYAEKAIELLGLDPKAVMKEIEAEDGF